MVPNTKTQLLRLMNVGILAVTSLFSAYNIYLDQFSLLYINLAIASICIINLTLLQFPSTQQQAFFVTFCIVFFVSGFSMLTAYKDFSRLVWIWPILFFSFYTLSMRNSFIFNVLLLLLAILILIDPFSLGTMLPVNKDTMRFFLSLLLTQLVFFTAEATRKKDEDSITQLAYIEISSGIPNQNGLLRHLNVLIQKKHTFTLLLIQIQDFPDLCKRVGYNDVDLFTKKATAILQTKITQKSFLAKTNEDTFFLILETMDTESVNKTGLQIKTQFNHLTNSLPELLRFDIEIGAVVFSNEKYLPTDLVRFTKIAIDEKKSSNPMVHFFKEAFLDKWDRKVSLTRLIRRGLKNKEFTIHYQPQIDAQSGKVVGVESLLRWQQTQTGIISPAELIATAEESDLIYTLGDYAIQKSLEGITKIHKENDSNITLAINLTPRQLLFDGLYTLLQQFIENTGIKSHNIELEISELTFTQKGLTVMRKLKSFKKLGIRIIINDFGSAITGLKYLTSYPISAVKIDKSLIHDFHKKEKKRSVIEALIYGLKKIDIEAIPEGVESIEQVKLLKEYGCSRLQGWYFSKALSLSDLQEFLKNKDEAY